MGNLIYLMGIALTVCLSADAARDRPDAFISNEESSHALMVLERDPTNTKSEPKKDSRPPKTNTNSATTGEPKEQGEAKPIQQQELIPTDLKIALALVGTWRVPTRKHSVLYLVKTGWNIRDVT